MLEKDGVPLELGLVNCTITILKGKEIILRSSV